MESVLQNVFVKVLNMSIGGAFVILAVLVARLCLRRAPRSISFVLWAIVAVRLLLPFTIESTHSPVPVTAEPVSVRISQNGAILTPEIDTGLAVIDHAVNERIPAATPQYSADPAQIALAIAAYIWIGGAILFAGADALSLFLLHRRLRGASVREAGVWEADRIPVPFVWGLFRPRIYIPERTPESAVPHILAHERAHLRRLDPLWKAVGCLILTLHWFNPLVWIAFILFVSDMEAACDEAVLRGSDGDIRAEYSEALLACASGGRLARIFPPAFGEADTGSRIRRVLRYKKSSRTVAIVAIIVTAAVCLGCAFSQRDLTDDSGNTPVSDSVDSSYAEDAGRDPSGVGTDTPVGSESDGKSGYALTFPAYADTRTPSSKEICENTAPFTVTVTLPDGWTIGAPESFSGLVYSPVSMLLSPVCLYLDGECVGSMGFYPIENSLSEIDPAREYFLACHRVMLGNNNTWDNDYTEIRAENTQKTGLCRISRREGGTLNMTYVPAIVAYDTELNVMIGVELLDSAVSDEEWRAIAESITLSAGGEKVEWDVPATQTAQITFPAYQGGRTEYNAAIYDTDPFTLTMELPLGWTMLYPADSQQTEALPFTPITLRWGNQTVGSVGFMTFELYEGVDPTDSWYYRMIYNQLMLGNVVTWDVDYTPVDSTRTDTFCAATCKVSEPIYEEGKSMAEMERREREAIVAYDTDMLVYIAMSFEENVVDESVWHAIAESIRLSPASSSNG